MALPLLYAYLVEKQLEEQMAKSVRWFEPHGYVNVQGWMKFIQGLYRVSKTVTAMRIFITIANNEIDYLDKLRASVLSAHERELKGWDARFKAVKDEFAAYVPWLEADPTPIATAATSAAVVYGFNGQPSIMQRLVELYNQIVGVSDLAEEYSPAGAFVINAYRAVDTQISRSSPGEEKTLRDYFDGSIDRLAGFFANLPKTAANLAVVAALGFGAIAAIYLIKK